MPLDEEIRLENDMNVAVIFAGGTGTRMDLKDKPKQFLMVHGKPIIVHTIEIFNSHPQIDGIVVVCLENWISYMEELQYRYRLDKIIKIVPGGETGQLSIYNGLVATEQYYSKEETIVLIHDGVRPIITHDLISANIETVKRCGSAITCSQANETFVVLDNNDEVSRIPERNKSRCAKAPQSFWLKDILEMHKKALSEGINNMIDSCTLMNYYGVKPAITECGTENIKITTPDDFYIFRALYDARENQQLLK